MAEIPVWLHRLPPYYALVNRRRKRRGKRGGVAVKLKILLQASSKLNTRIDRLSKEGDSNRSYAWRSSLDAYAWNIPILPSMGDQWPRHRSPHLRRRGVSAHLLRPLRRASRQMEDPVQLRMALINARYFSDTKQTVVSTFLGLVELEGGDARSIACAVVGFLVKCGLKKEKLLGIGTDNASVMTGINNGVHKVLKEEYGLKDLIIRCVCHSLQLAVSHASNDTIPRSVEYLVRETYNWLSVSPKRREAYKAIYETINCGEKPLQITKVCATRWLSIEPAVSRILDQWEELRLHFSVTKQ
ncbi:hypothetical protein PO909_005800 [Leuciscus waleckii]